MSHVEIRHPIVDTRLFVAVEGRLEDLSSCLPVSFVLTLIALCHFLFTVFIMLSYRRVIWLQLDSLSAVCEGLREILQMQVCQTTQIKCFS